MNTIYNKLGFFLPLFHAVESYHLIFTCPKSAIPIK